MRKVLYKYVVIIFLAYTGVFLSACAKMDMDSQVVNDKKTTIKEQKNYSEEILSQVIDIMQEAQKVRYKLENCSISTVDESKEGGYIVRRLSFAADWNRIREPKEDPLIKGMYKAVDELVTEKEKKAGEHIIDGFLTEMDGEPESERVKTKIVVKIDVDNNQFELFYPHVYEGQETLYPLKEYAQQNWAENAAERFQRGKEIIYENITDD